MGWIAREPFQLWRANDAFLFESTSGKSICKEWKVIPRKHRSCGEIFRRFQRRLHDQQPGVLFSTLTLRPGAAIGNHFYRYDIGQPVCDLDSAHHGNSGGSWQSKPTARSTAQSAHERVLLTLSKKTGIEADCWNLSTCKEETLRSNRAGNQHCHAVGRSANRRLYAVIHGRANSRTVGSETGGGNEGGNSGRLADCSRQ